MTKRVLVVGDFINDILVKSEAAARLDTDVHARIQNHPGGSAANFACWLAAEGFSVDLVARVSEEEHSALSGQIRGWGVNPKLQSDSIAPTGAIVALVEGNHRTFYTQRGANDNLDLSQIDELGSYDLAYISGYTIAASKDPSKVEKFFSKLKTEGVPIAVDPGSAGFIADFSPVRFMEIIEGVDYLFPSLEEGRLLSGEDNPEIIAKFLSERVVHSVVTLAENGAVYCSGEALHLVPALNVEVVDPTGAGDAFAAGFIAKSITGKSPEASLKHAMLLGARAVGNLGGRPLHGN